MSEWIRESNLIEGVDDPTDDIRCLKAWNWFIKQPLTLSIILKLHERIMGKIDPSIAGKWRTCNVRVGHHLAPGWEHVPRLAGEWLLYHGSSISEESIRKAHVFFEHVHPFVDGNGRTGRMLMNSQRVKAGLEPLLIKASERQGYYKWFEP